MDGGGGVYPSMYEITFGTINVGNGSISVVGDRCQTLEFTGYTGLRYRGSYLYHSGGTHGENYLYGYNFNGKKSTRLYLTSKDQSWSRSQCDGSGPLLVSRMPMVRELQLNMSHNVADSGMSIESNGNVNIGRSMVPPTLYPPTEAEELCRYAVRHRNTAIETNGLNGRLILAYESDYFENGGTKDYAVDRDDPSANHGWPQFEHILLHHPSNQ